ncbi:MAG: hypothetical protein GXP32_04890 [Kiritimatiellaeota bacterium]|nr:hypothetical protein [Kiritimatiellota bacterium]
MKMTFNSDGSRSVSERPNNSKTNEKTFFIGGSFIQGWAVSDNETMAWKVQKLFPKTWVRNFGVGGYGTLQSYMTLRKISKKITPYSIVFYGLIEHHEDRDVAPEYWLEALSRYSKRGHVALPWASLDPKTGELVFQKPESYTHAPLREYSAAVTVIEKAAMLLKTAGRMRGKREILKKLILRMNALVKKRKGRFLVILFASPKEFLTDMSVFLKENGIGMVNCAYKQTPALTVSGEGHPNGAMNTLWAKDVAEVLTRMTKIKRPAETEKVR